MSVEEDKAKARKMMEELRNGTRLVDDEMIDFFKSLTPNFKVGIKVISQEGICLGKLKVGDEWVMKGRGDDWKVPSICMFAMSAILPHVQLLMYGGSFPWEPDSDVVIAACPDTRNPVVFELKRMEQV